MTTTTAAGESLSTQEQFEKAMHKAKYCLPIYILVPLASLYTAQST
jgi:hypothetical protein